MRYCSLGTSHAAREDARQTVAAGVPEDGRRAGENMSRVEVWRGSLGRSLFSLFARPFVCGCPKISTMPRLRTPLIEPDRRISRTRLSDKAPNPRPT